MAHNDQTGQSISQIMNAQRTGRASAGRAPAGLPPPPRPWQVGPGPSSRPGPVPVSSVTGRPAMWQTHSRHLPLSALKANQSMLPLKPSKLSPIIFFKLGAA